MSRAKALLLILVGTVLLSGCDFDVYKLPLPGGTDVGSDPITVHVEFRDVLDLVPKSTVKVNDVSVGQVTDIKLQGYTADVTLQVRNDVKLPDNAIAEIRQTSLLGEKFVSLSAPAAGASDGLLQSGDEIPLERTGNNPEVEEVLGALSLLLNGGGVAQLKTIATELNKTLEGREDTAKSVLTQIASFTQQLDDNKVQIVNAIESLNRLALNVHAQQGTIDAALEQLPSALQSLDSQRGDLVKMLQALNELGDVGVRVIQASKQSTIESIQQLQPVLTELASTGDDFVKAFNVFLTYPFVDEVVGRDPQVARNLHMGDYTNLSIELPLDLTGSGTAIPTLPTNLPTIVDPGAIVTDVLKCLRSGDLTSKACKRVLTRPGKLLNLLKECQKRKNRDKDLCKQLNLLPGLPHLPGLPGLPAIPGLPDLGGVLGLPRPAFGPTASWSKTRGPTLRQLTAVFDPALVQLLVPGMVVR
jgi:phospholipid/cholesterol/gamma-HCH transport system substrate-binding protein